MSNDTESKSVDTKNLDTKKQKSAKASASVEPKIIERSKRKVLHHLFKAQIAKFKKNTSFTPGAPRLHDVEHVHFFHSVDSVGHPQQFTNHVGGHCHKIDWSVDENGNLVAKCGPAVRKRKKVTRSGNVQTVYEPVFFNKKASAAEDSSYTEEVDEIGVDEKLVDRHTHTMTYLGSDEVDPKIMGAIITMPSDGLEEDRKTLEEDGVKIT